MSFAIAPASGFAFDWPYWGFHGSANAEHASIQPGFKRAVIHTRDTGPFGQRVSSSIMDDHAIRSHIVHLCDLSGPSAISARIAKRVINAINRMSIRTLAHIGNESLEIIDPQRVNSHIKVVVSTSTAVLHSSPRPVSKWMKSLESLRRFSNAFIAITSAARRNAVTQWEGCHLLFSSTFASAQPVNRLLTMRVINAPKDGPAIKGLSSEINRRHV